MALPKFGFPRTRGCFTSAGGVSRTSRIPLGFRPQGYILGPLTEGPNSLWYFQVHRPRICLSFLPSRVVLRKSMVQVRVKRGVSKILSVPLSISSEEALCPMARHICAKRMQPAFYELPNATDSYSCTRTHTLHSVRAEPHNDFYN